MQVSNIHCSEKTTKRNAGECQGKHAIAVEEILAVKQKDNIKKIQEVFQEENGLQNVKQELISELHIWTEAFR